MRRAALALLFNAVLDASTINAIYTANNAGNRYP